MKIAKSIPEKKASEKGWASKDECIEAILQASMQRGEAPPPSTWLQLLSLKTLHAMYIELYEFIYQEKDDKGNLVMKAKYK